MASYEESLAVCKAKTQDAKGEIKEIVLKKINQIANQVKGTSKITFAQAKALLQDSRAKLKQMEDLTVNYVAESQEIYFNLMVGELTKPEGTDKINLFLYQLGWAFCDLWVNEETRGVIIDTSLGAVGGRLQAVAGLDPGELTVRIFGKSGALASSLDFRFKDAKQLKKFIELVSEAKDSYGDLEKYAGRLLDAFEKSLN